MLNIDNIPNFDERVNKITSAVSSIENFPKEGILFRDVSTLINNAEAFRETIDLFYDIYKDEKIDCVAAADARGFIFGAALAYRLGTGMVMIRKKGKLPGATVSVDYSLEYGTGTLEIKDNALKKGQKVLVLDDLLATGGTAGAMIELCRKFGADIHSFGCVIDLFDLGGAKYLKDKYNTNTVSLIKFPGH